MEVEKPIMPFLKWAGGKRWLIENYPTLFPVEFNRYIEPFLGAGAVFFALKPKKSILSDLNKNLIDVYRAIRKDPNKVEKLLFCHHAKHCKEYYYEMRRKKLRTDATRAAQFIYLNRTCWNGLYRVNLNGEFNVPIGTKKSVVMDIDNYQGVAKLLKKARLEDKDFGPIISKAKEGDFVFIDPPYTVKHNNNNFRKYNEQIFSWEDQVRLRDMAFMAKEKGARVLVCNANNPVIRKLYRGFGKIKVLYRNSYLAADPMKRQLTSEIAIMSKD